MDSKEIGDTASSYHQGNGNGSCCPSSSYARRPPSDSVADMSIFRPPNETDPFWDPGQMMLENQATGTGNSCHFPWLLPNIPPNMSTSPYPLGLDSLESSPNGKTKTKCGIAHKDPNGEALDPTNNQGKDNSNCASESIKENYIHVRGKRGKATNRHCLAERLRREKISERMKLLQQLVPGWSKISGKAVMLDEIINYVQSLQQQVEFLSMKLATVNPELNMDMENMLSKDVVLRSQCGSNAMAALGIGSEVRCSEAIHGFPSSSAPPFHHLQQSVWNDRIQGILQMGSDLNPSLFSSSLEPNSSGLSKLEL